MIPSRTLRALRLVPLVLVALVAMVSSVRAEDPYKVLVNSGNSAGSLSKEKVAAYFLKKETRWSDGSKVTVVDRDPGAAVRAAFSKSVLGKDVAAVKSYWQRQLFSGKDTPPAELDSDREVIELVAKTPGGIGYVSASTELPAGVKAIRIGG